MEKNKFVLPILIFLLIIFTPLSFYGTYKYIINKMERGNPAHEPKIGNTLYFYNTSDKLIGTYTCENIDCEIAQSQIDDEYLDYYEGINTTINAFSNYAFVNDNGIKLVSLTQTGKSVIASVNLIKNYGTTIENNYVIIKNDQNKYGLFSLENVLYVIKAEYDFLGLANNFAGGVLNSSKIAALQGDKWFILSSAGEVLTTPVEMPIYTYNDNVVVYVSSDKYYITNYDNSLLFDEDVSKVKINSEYIIFNSNNYVYVYSSDFSNFYQKYNANDFKLENNNLTLLDANDSTLEEVDLTTLTKVEVQSDLKTYAKNVISGAEKAVTYEKNYGNVTKEKDLCFSISYLQSKNYLSLDKSVTGSVYMKYISEDKYKTYIWISDYQNALGVYNKENFIGGAYSENIDNYPINNKISASSLCGSTLNNSNVQYFN